MNEPQAATPIANFAELYDRLVANGFDPSLDLDTYDDGMPCIEAVFSSAEEARRAEKLFHPNDIEATEPDPGQQDNTVWFAVQPDFPSTKNGNAINQLLASCEEPTTFADELMAALTDARIFQGAVILHPEIVLKALRTLLAPHCEE